MALAFIAGIPTHALAGGALTGVVRDSVGKALSGAEVLVLSERGPLPLATAQTDGTGWFRIGGLPPGVYRVAAIKQGYLAYLGQVNTLLRASMEVVLRPLPPGATPRPETMSWALRLPERSLLRETDASDLLAKTTGGSRLLASGFAEAIQGQFEHLVALAWVPGSPGAVEENQGARTHLKLRGAIGLNTSIRLEGERDSLDSLGGREDPASGASGERSTLRLAASFHPDAATKIEVATFRGDARLWVLPDSAGPRGFSQAESAWGGTAGWSREVASGTRLDVRLRYVDAGLGASTPDAAIEPGSSWDPVSNRSVGAEGWYETVAREDHQIRVGVGAHLLRQSSAPDMRSSFPVTLGGFPDTSSGWTVRVRAEDQWLLSGPFGVILGLDADESLEPGGLDLMAPRVGGTVRAGRWRARGTLEYLVADRERGSGAEGTLASRDPLGFEADVESALPGGVKLTGRYLRRPADTGLRSSEGGPSPAPYVTDGLAAVESASLGLERQAKDVTFLLRVSAGRVEGRVAHRPPFIVLLEPLSDRLLSHRTGRVGIHLARTGTDLAADYWEIEEDLARKGQSSAGRKLDRYLDLLLAQDLVQFRDHRASCRLLVSARALMDDEDAEASKTRTVWDALRGLNHRVSAGLSVAF